MNTPVQGKMFHSDNIDTNPARGHWGSRAEFILSCIGYSVGLGNVWRFPFLAYANGGGAFLIPYIIILVLVGKPMYFMEAAIGQYSQVGPLAMWSQLLPGSVGIGAGMVIISVIVAIYYNVIMAYCLFYLFNSFGPVLPWTVCDESWGADERCYVRNSNKSEVTLSVGQVSQGHCIVDDLGGCVESSPQTSTEQYWEKAVLHFDHDGLQDFGDIGQFQYHLAFCLALSWFVVSCCVIKGVKSTGKVVYFTATFPYVILLILLVQGLCLEGSIQGITYLFVPDWSKLADISVWRAAAGQVFFSLGISWGGIIMFGSYNDFSSKVHIDAHIVSVVDFITSLIASIVIFSTLGHSAHNLGVPIQTVAKGGQGLAFVAYPEALAMLPGSNFWCVIFFLMLFLLGLDSEFALFETALVSIYDAFPRLRNKKILVTILTSLSCFLLGLPCVFSKGQFVLDLMDTYGASISVMVIAIFEMIAIMWIYGVNSFCEDLKIMLGFSPNIYFKVCWVVICPLLLTCIFVAACIAWSPPSYGDIKYPDWAHSIGWFLALISIVQVPFWLIFTAISKCIRREGICSVFKTTNHWLTKSDVKLTNSGLKIDINNLKTASINSISSWNKNAKQAGNGGAFKMKNSNNECVSELNKKYSDAAGHQGPSIAIFPPSPNQPPPPPYETYKQDRMI